MSATDLIETGLVSFLLSKPSVTNLVDNRIESRMPLDESGATVWPTIVYFRVPGTTRILHHDDNDPGNESRSSLKKIMIQLDSYAEEPLAPKEVSRVLAQELQGYRGLMGSQYANLVTVSGPWELPFDFESRLYKSTLTVSIETHSD